MGIVLRRERLDGVHPRLIAVADRAAALLPFDILITDGVRSRKRQEELYGHGRTPDELRAVGLSGALAQPRERKVTWTLTSKHFVNLKTGYGHALDCYKAPFSQKQTPAVSRQIARAFLQAANELDTPVRWGADWDRDGVFYEKGESDSPHFELWGL